MKFFKVEARFPESVKEVPAAEVEYAAQQVKVPAEAYADYEWQSKAIRRHRGENRAACGFRANAEEDQDRLAAWLATALCPVELSHDRLAGAVVARCRNDHIEPSAPGQVRRLTLLAMLCHVRQKEITDSLVDLFIQLVLKINTGAERGPGPHGSAFVVLGAPAADVVAAAEGAGAAPPSTRPRRCRWTEWFPSSGGWRS
ncbi:DUF4158 domain-containing protein [Streptomyces sp. NPDC002054]|uniref:DUF4158 domain-containing protein n=1 Tax=Streptomyces sp. NPDC002054 TaxID=3154663 RepID=UPI00331B67C3